MFENQSANPQQPKADDIFEGLDQGGTVPAQSALQPQAAAQFNVEQVRQAAYQEGEKTNGRALAVVGGLVFGLLILAVGVWGALFFFKNKTADQAAIGTPVQKTANDAVKGNEAAKVPDQVPVQNSQQNATAVNSAVSTSVPADINPTDRNLPTSGGANATPANTASAPTVGNDADRDGLSDNEEAQAGTSPLKADTDGDGLSDSEELKTYFTNPLKADTDGDGFTDGAEVKSGYNPNGPGKLSR